MLHFFRFVNSHIILNSCSKSLDFTGLGMSLLISAGSRYHRAPQPTASNRRLGQDSSWLCVQE